MPNSSPMKSSRSGASSTSRSDFALRATCSGAARAAIEPVVLDRHSRRLERHRRTRRRDAPVRRGDRGPRTGARNRGRGVSVINTKSSSSRNQLNRCGACARPAIGNCAARARRPEPLDDLGRDRNPLQLGVSPRSCAAQHPRLAAFDRELAAIEMRCLTSKLDRRNSLTSEAMSARSLNLAGLRKRAWASTSGMPDDADVGAQSAGRTPSAASNSSQGSSRRTRRSGC